MAYTGKEVFEAEKLRDKQQALNILESRGDGLFSLADIIRFEMRKARGDSTLAREIEENKDLALLDSLNLNLSKNDIRNLSQKPLNEQKVYTKEALEYAAEMRRAMVDRGYDVTGYRLDYQTNSILNAVVVSGSGQAQVIGLSPLIGDLGKMHINGRFAYLNKEGLWHRNEKTVRKHNPELLEENGGEGPPFLRSTKAGVEEIMKPLDFMFLENNNAAVVQKTKGGNDAVYVFERDYTQGSGYQILRDELKKLQEINPDATFNDVDVSKVIKRHRDASKSRESGKRAYNGVVYIAKPYEQDRSMEEAILNLKDVQKISQPETFRELIDYTYALAREDEDEQRAFGEEILDQLPPTDALFEEDGRVRLELVDFDVLKQYAPSNELVMELMAEEQAKYLEAGYTVDQFRHKMLRNLSHLARQTSDAEQAEIRARLLEENLDAELSEEELNRLIEQEMELNRGANQDNESLDYDAIEDDSDPEMSGSANVSTRQYLLNLMPGLTDENGTPHVGWLDEERMTKWHKETIQVAAYSAEQSGVEHFEARFDNDGVLHWKGIRDG